MEMDFEFREGYYKNSGFVGDDEEGMSIIDDVISLLKMFFTEEERANIYKKWIPKIYNSMCILEPLRFARREIVQTEKWKRFFGKNSPFTVFIDDYANQNREFHDFSNVDEAVNWVFVHFKFFFEKGELFDGCSLEKLPFKVKNQEEFLEFFSNPENYKGNIQIPVYKPANIYIVPKINTNLCLGFTPNTVDY